MKKLYLLPCLLVLTACATQTFKMSTGGGVEAKNEGQTFFIYGLGQERTLDAAQICGGQEKVVKVQSEQTFLNGLLAAITAGIYTPRQARVYCSN